MAKISRKDTIRMAIRYIEGATNVELAEEFGVALNTINTVKHKSYWKPTVDAVLNQYIDKMVHDHLN